MASCSWIVQVFAVFGVLSLLGSLAFLAIAIAAERTDRRALRAAEGEPSRPSFFAEAAERVRTWWNTTDLGWVGFMVAVMILGGIVLWVVLDVVNRPEGVFGS